MKRAGKHSMRFLEYANMPFQGKDEAALTWAWQLSMPTLRGAGGSTWSKAEAWETLRAHQPQFRKFLDAIIAHRLTRVFMQELTAHCTHIRIESTYSMASEQSRELATKQYNDTRSALRQSMAQQLGREVGGNTPAPPLAPPARYNEVPRSQDPLDAPYLDLREFFRAGTLDRLKQCPACQRYFVQRTAHQGYCSTPCRRKADSTSRARNARYQRDFRARKRKDQIKEDLQRVKKWKAQYKAKYRELLTLHNVLDDLPMSIRRWNMLQRWEVEQHGFPQITDLTS